MSLKVDVRHHLGGFELNAQFTAPAGLTALFGRSGAGKSSLLRAVAGLLQPQAGRISLEARCLFDASKGVHLPPHQRRMGVVFQDARLFPHLSVARNLAYGARRAHEPLPETEVDRITDLLDLGPLLARRPARLSGGERQRVAIGRALMSAPAMVLADEPLASLDAPRKAEILPYLERLRDEMGVPILYVSHDAAEVARLATHVVALEAGRVVAEGPAMDILADPSVIPVGVAGLGAVLDVRVAELGSDGLCRLEAGGLSLFVPSASHQIGERLRLRVAAQDVILSTDVPGGLSALNVLPGRVAAVEPTGSAATVCVDTAAGRVLARVTMRSVARLGLVPDTPCHAIIKTIAIARNG